MRKLNFKIFLVLFVVIIAASFSACSSPVLSRPLPSPGVTTIKINGSCDISINNNVVTVSGQTDIMDGAILQIAVLGQNGMTLDSVIITKSGDQISHDFTITDKYKGVTAVTGFITCMPKLYGNQPDAVYKAYGNKFENVDAAQWNAEGNIIIFQSKTIDLPKAS